MAPCANAATLEAYLPTLETPQLQARSVGADPANVEADFRLATRCVAGEVAAWEQLYTQCHDPLCDFVRFTLGRGKSNRDLIDEIAARVWYRLVDNDGELLARYSPKRGARLITFMRALAKDEIRRNFRTEARRRNRESIAVKTCPRRGESDFDILGSDLKQFLTTLTPKEHKFCCEVLLADSGVAEGVVRTRSNVWQLTHRVYAKLLHFLGR
jgi:DNA-directed RNA polymerase specialized sigma24 family protein